MRVADFLADFLVEVAGIQDIFMLTGAGIMHLTDGVACQPRLRAICVQHEQAASMALEAYARMNGNFGAGLFSTGPGALNALTGLGGAWQDSVPCLFISGQVKRSETTYAAKIEGLRQFGVQELDVMPVVSSLCKYAVHLEDPARIRFELEKCYSIAREGRPGPVWMEIPLDVQAATVEVDDLIGYTSSYSAPQASQSDIEFVADALAASNRPVIIAGRGVRLAQAQDSLAEFAERLSIPVVTPYLGIDNFRHDKSFYIGKVGVKGDRAANLAMQNADLILAIGTSLHVSVIGYDYTQFARGARKVVVDIDATSHRKPTIGIDRFVHADALAVVDAIKSQVAGLTPEGYSSWLNRCKDWVSRYPVCLPEYAELRNEINIYTFVEALSRQSGAGDVFVSDAGSAFYAVSQGLLLTKENQRYIPSSAMATMGYSLPAAIGVAAIHKDGQVLAVTGDGSFQQNIQELVTVAHYGFPIKLFVLNNDGYLSIRASQSNYFQERFIGESPASGVSMPDTLDIARAYKINAERVRDPRELEGAISRALEHKGPFILEIVSPRDQPIIPTVGSRLNPDGSMTSRPLEDMSPFLDRAEYLANMIIEAVD